MSVRVALPPGCSGFTGADGSKDLARKPGGTVELSDDHAARLAGSRNVASGLISLNAGTRLATKAGRRCPACRFLAQGWSAECPRCGGATVPE